MGMLNMRNYSLCIFSSFYSIIYVYYVQHTPKLVFDSQIKLAATLSR